MTNLPTLYEYYTGGGIHRGLSVDQPYFMLNNRNISIYGGSMHYFRVPKDYWRDRLRKMRAAGLNVVQTYVPWNLHEPVPGIYDFGNGNTDMQEFLDIEKFLRIAQEEDLFVIMRPGPFICAEFEFGGLPSWLLREKNIKVRTSDEKYMTHVRRYFNVLLALLASFQFLRGGPIIAFQVENEYGSTENPKGNPPFKPDLVYMEELQQLMMRNNITELHFTSDSPYAHGNVGSLPSLFQTANLNQNPERQFESLSVLQPNKPFMVTEFWAGWFRHWSEEPFQSNITTFKDVLERILKYPASVSFYMFHGGTSWGLLNGANIRDTNQSGYQPDITSYDYDAPLTEYGGYTTKYFIIKDSIEKYNQQKTKLPALPDEMSRKAYPCLKILKYLPYKYVISQLPFIIAMKALISMENLPINKNTGQHYGYVLYRKEALYINRNAVLKIKGYVTDTVNVYINNQLVTNNVNNLNEFGYWRKENSSMVINRNEPLENATLDLVICNMGRNNFGFLEMFLQFKGLFDSVYLDDEELLDWLILPMEFKKSWINSLTNWIDFNLTKTYSGMSFYKTELILENTFDTFIDMSNWKKGFVIVNGFILGRYWEIGPQQTLYLPAPLLRTGINEIIVVDEFSADTYLKFSDTPLNFNK